MVSARPIWSPCMLGTGKGAICPLTPTLPRAAGGGSFTLHCLDGDSVLAYLHFLFCKNNIYKIDCVILENRHGKKDCPVQQGRGRQVAER